MNEQDIKRLNENLQKIVSKIQSLEKRIDGVVHDFELLTQDLSLLTSAHNSAIKELKGTQTALIGAGILTRDGLDLHTSFDVPDDMKVSQPDRTDDNKPGDNQKNEATV